MEKENGRNEYLELCREVAETFPVVSSLYDLGKILDKVGAVRDPKTGRTLGEAIDILNNLADDRTVVKEFVRRWHMVNNLDTVFKHYIKPAAPRTRLQKAKELLVEDPRALITLLADPEIMSKISGVLIQSLPDVDWYRTINLIQETILLMRMYYPQEYEQVTKDLFYVKDSDADVSIMDCLLAMSNILSGSLFREKLREYLHMESLKKMHERTQDTMQLLLESGVLNSSPVPEPDAKLIDTLTPETVQEDLRNIDVEVSEETAERLLEEARQGTLFEEFMGRMKEGEKEYGKLTPEIVAALLKKENVDVEIPQIKSTMELVAMLPAEIIKGQLEQIGIQATMEEIQELQQKCAQYQPLDETADELTDQPTAGLEDELTDQPTAGLEDELTDQPTDELKDEPTDWPSDESKKP